MDGRAVTGECDGGHRRRVGAAATGLAVVSAVLLLAACASPSPRVDGSADGGTGAGAGTDLPLGDISSSDTTGTGVAVAGPVTALARVLDLELCPFAVKNAPPTVGRKIARRSAMACVDGVELDVAPAPGACMTSGFGQRNGKLHSGVDYQSRPAGGIVAAASGVVRERKVRPRMGNWVVVDHGNDVFTGYAHLASIEDGVQVGARVEAGQPLGIMGNTGRGISAVHLHYEIRRGDYDRAGFFGLEPPLDPFDQPGACVRDA